MKKFFSKKWHGIPVALVSAVLLACMLAGSAVAGYGFFKANMTVEVREAVAASYGWDDDLSPYMIPLGGVLPSIVADPVKWKVDESGTSATFTITKGAADASEFVAGEVLVIPIALRNRGDAPLTVTASYTRSNPGIALTCSFEENTATGGLAPKRTGEAYRATGAFVDLNSFTTVLPAHGGNFGSAQTGATVLFIKVTVANDAVPSNYTIVVTLSRS